jgi:hypothetical protein
MLRDDEIARMDVFVERYVLPVRLWLPSVGPKSTRGDNAYTKRCVACGWLRWRDASLPGTYALF